MAEKDEKPNAPSCERNRDAILKKIQPQLTNKSYVLELGSGTGQHAVFFALNMPWLQWQPTEVTKNLSGIEAWRKDTSLDNVLPVLELDFNRKEWPVKRCEAIFTANTFHIISSATLENCFAGIGQVLQPGGVLLVYGPFKYRGDFTSESNGRFDIWLKERDPDSGIKDFEWICQLATKQNLVLVNDFTMPANNQLLVFQSPSQKSIAQS